MIELRTYTSLGAFIVMLCAAVTGCDSSDSADSIEVRIEADRLTGNAPMRVTFQALAQAGLDAELSYRWTFGDDETSDEAEPSHVYTRPGEYTVELEVESDDGRKGTANLTVTAAGGADLVVADVISTPQRARAGDELTVTWSIQNLGATVIGDWGYSIILSTDRVLDEADIVAGRMAEGEPVSAERAEGRELAVVLPSELETGDYHVGVVADAELVIGDADRESNVGWTAGRLQIRNPTDTGPDLVICGLSIPAFNSLPPDVTATTQLDDQLEIEVCIGNNGNRPVGAGSFTLTMSSDDVLDSEDIVVGGKRNLALGAGDRETVSVLMDIGGEITPGDWHLFAVADAEGSIEEQQETNNDRRWADPIRVVEPGQVEGVDLVVRSMEFQLQRVYWGQTVPGTITLINRGDQSVERFFVVRFTAEALTGEAPIQIHSLNVEGLAAGAEVTLDVALPINRRLAQGDYRISAVADPTNSTDDVNEANNGRTLQQPLTLGGEPSVDVVVDNVVASPASVEAGGTLHVEGRVRNGGNDPTGIVEYIVVLSADESYGPEDRVIAMDSFMNIDGGQASAVNADYEVPLDLDQQVPAWFVGVIADPANRLTGETSEDNNASFSLEAITVTGSSGGCAEDDREPNNNSASAQPIELGSYAGLGLCGNSDWYLVAVSPHAVLDARTDWDIDEGALELNVFDGQLNVLGTGEGVQGSLHAFAMPSGVERNVLVEVRSTGTRFQYDLELTERVVAEGIDLRVRALSLSPQIAQPGQMIGAQFEVVNLGTAEAPASEAGVFLNSTPDIRGAGFLSRIEVGAIPARSALAVQGTFSLPADTEDGIVVIGIEADTTEQVEEGSDDDNAGFAPLRVDAEQACMADRLEPNGSPHEPDTATFAAPVLAGVYDGLTSCYGDDDWYAIVLEPGQRLSAEINYAQENGDLELSLYAPDGETLLDESTRILGVDSVGLARAEAAGAYLLRVYVRPGQMVNANDYRLSLTVEDTEACQDDAFEPNETRDAAQLLPDGLHDLRLCAGGQDWYRFAIPAGNTVSWQLTAGQAPLTITLLDPDGVEVDTDDRRIAHQARQNGFYYLGVIAGEEGEYIYQLRVSGVSGVDLAVEAIDLSRASVQPSGDLRVRARVSNLRGDNARNIPIRYLLSSDASASAEDTVLAETLLPLIEGASVIEVDQRISLPDAFDMLPGFVAAMFPLVANVVAVLDPERTVPDVRPNNNQSSAPLELRVACIDDDDRSNEAPGNATPLDLALGEYNGAICAFTEDWFLLEAAPAGVFEVRLSFDNDQGDLDLVVRDADTGEQLGASRTEEDTEVIRLVLGAPTQLHIGVDGFDEAANEYALSWSAQ